MSDSELRVRLGGRSDLADVQPYMAPQMEAAIKLNTNESPYPPPPQFFEELAVRLSKLQLNRYPLREFNEAREAVAARTGTLTERVWLANGSNEIFLQLLLAFGGVERKAMTLEPSYSMHSHIVRITGTRHLRGRRNPDYSLEINACSDAIDVQKPDIVLICAPNNPTGTGITEDELRVFCERAPGLVILDEAYVEFGEGSFVRLMEEFDNLVVTRSFSKAWRLAGARLGYLVAQPWVIEEVMKVRLPYHLSSLSQAAALTALGMGDELLSTVETIKHERDRLYRELSTTRGVAAIPSLANFVLFRCLEKPGTEVWKALLEKGVLIRDFSDVPGCQDCLRVSVGTPEQDEKFLEALAEALAT
ncbi:MAG TPA: histidinol-phosphate transaminase [Actinomycetota bacterium]|nr:histidinol-phosphate transaminase [Actinomycetota bacterium]